MKPNLINSIKLKKPRKNLFDLSHDVKFSCNMGQLVPVLALEAVPGDKFILGADALIRLAPMVAPVMHRMDLYIHYYFVPNRILWDGWSDFITNTKTGGVLPAFPTLDIHTSSYTKLCDYLGIPTPVGAADLFHEPVSALPFAAYQCIWNEYYRDQNLQAEIDWHLNDGDQSANAELWKLRNRCWEHDPFTAALPFAQKGTAVDIPLGKVMLDPATNNPGIVVAANDHNTLESGILGVGPSGGPTDGHLRADYGTAFERDAVYDPNGTLITEPTTINDLRRAFRLQEWFEKMARGGSRLVEVILSHFGVRSSDARLQRPEYIVGVKNPVQISEVLNTTGTDEAPQGNMSGHGLSVASGRNGSYYCEEHGFIIGIMSVMPKTAYQQGIPKSFLKVNDPTEYFWPAFANLGEEPVLNKEVYAFQGGTGSDAFGYLPRYWDYKVAPSRVAGDMRSSLDFWHLGRIFANPASALLTADFVECKPDYRIFAVTDANVDHLWCHVFNNIKAIRPMPKFGTPTI